MSVIKREHLYLICSRQEPAVQNVTFYAGRFIAFEAFIHFASTDNIGKSAILLNFELCFPYASKQGKSRKLKRSSAVSSSQKMNVSVPVYK